MMKKCIVILVVFIFSITNVYALGISPARIDIEFTPGLKQDITFFVFNTGNTSFPAEVSFVGELSRYSNFNKETFVLEPFEQKQFKMMLEFPSSFEVPGWHGGEIVAKQTELSNVGGNGNSIGALVVVRASVNFFVPYESPYLGATFEVGDVELGQKVPLMIRLKNLGTGPIGSLDGIITIIDPDGNEIDKLTFDDYLGALEESKDLVIYWDTEGHNAGIYNAKLKIDYEYGVYESEGEFKVGDFFIEILKLKKFIYTKEINEYDVTLLSKWNGRIKEAYSVLSINYNNDIKEFKSESFDIDGWTNKTIKVYVDARDMEKGTYPAKYSVFYGNESNIVNFDIKLVERSDEIIFYGLIAAGIILVLAIIFIIFRKKFIKEKRGK